MGNALLGTIVVTLWSLRNLDASGLAVAAKESLCRRVNDIHASDIDKVVMESHHQGVSDGTPYALLVTTHIVLLATDVYLHAMSLWGVHTEVGTTLAVNLGELVARYGGLSNLGISRNGKRRTYLIAQQRQHLLAIATAKLTVAGSIEVQLVTCQDRWYSLSTRRRVPYAASWAGR